MEKLDEMDIILNLRFRSTDLYLFQIGSQQFIKIEKITLENFSWSYASAIEEKLFV